MSREAECLNIQEQVWAPLLPKEEKGRSQREEKGLRVWEEVWSMGSEGYPRAGDKSWLLDERHWGSRNQVD